MMEKQNLVQTFLSIPAFDKKYWESDDRNKIERFFDEFVGDLTENIQIPNADDPIKLSNFYYMKALSTLNQSETLKMARQAADLGNPYAMIFVADSVMDIQEQKKYIKLAYDVGSPEGIIRYIMDYIKEEYKVDELEKIVRNNLQIELSPELENRIVEDLKIIPDIDIDQNFKRYAISIYDFLDAYSSKRHMYIDRLMLFRLQNHEFSTKDDLMRHRPEILLIIQLNFEKKKKIDELEKENQELRKAYDELKKLKELNLDK